MPPNARPNSNASKPAPGMLQNLPVKSLTHKDLTIEGYSRAAVQS